MRKLPVLALVLPLALGCGSDNGGNGGNGGITEPPDLGDFPLGTFVATLEESDVSEEYLFLVGTLRVTFNSDATWSATLPSGFVSGTFAVSGDQYTQTDIGGPESCGLLGTGFASGTYTWSFVGSALSFVVVSDNCTGRTVGLTTKPYIEE